MIFSEEYLAAMPDYADLQVNPWYVTFAKSPSFAGLRELLEIYAAKIPGANRAELLTRIRSFLKGDHIAALNELFLYAVLDAHGLSPMFQQSIGGKKPDFILEDTDKQTIILEALSRLPSKDQELSHKRINELLSSINRFSPKIFPGIALERHIPCNLKIKCVARELCKRISQEAVIPEYIDLSTFGISGKLILKPEMSGIIGLPLIGEWKTDTIVARLNEKRKKYKQLGLKLIIAVFNDDFFEFSYDDLEVGLFGKPVANFTFNRATMAIIKSGSTRTSDGYFGIEKSGKPRNTSISAIMYLKTRFRENRLLYEANLIHNPLTKAPINQDLFAGIPQLIFSDDDITMSSHWTQKRETVFELRKN